MGIDRVCMMLVSHSRLGKPSPFDPLSYSSFCNTNIESCHVKTASWVREIKSKISRSWLRCCSGSELCDTWTQAIWITGPEKDVLLVHLCLNLILHKCPTKAHTLYKRGLICSTGNFQSSTAACDPRRKYGNPKSNISHFEKDKLAGVEESFAWKEMIVGIRAMICFQASPQGKNCSWKRPSITLSCCL